MNSRPMNHSIMQRNSVGHWFNLYGVCLSNNSLSADDYFLGRKFIR